MPSRIGSPDWAERTQGRLSFTNKLTIFTQIIRLEIASKLNRSRIKPASVDLDSIRIPDSPIAKQAMEHCEEVSPLPLFYHCMRTYSWGMILAQANTLTVDEELFFVMAQLHDLGLVDEYHGKDVHAACFAVEGSRFAEGFCTEHGWDNHRAEQVKEAISLHLNIDVAIEEGVEAHLLRAGSGLDVVGTRRLEIGRQTRKAVIERYPRDDMFTAMDGAMQRELQQRRHSRISYLYRFGFGDRMKGNRL